MDQDPPQTTALAARFETHRPHVHAVARRLLGSAADAQGHGDIDTLAATDVVLLG